jgi:uncharacterized damage-inducible protein DinB
MNKGLKKILDKWKEMRRLTLDLLEAIPEDKLNFTVGKNMGTIGKQYRHIGDVQLCYVEAIKTGKIDFSKYRRDYSIENLKQKLKLFLKEINDEMLKEIKKNPDAEIDWFEEKLDLKDHVNALIQHEILHHGELIVYIRTLGLKFPKSWEMWGL